jgi:hypothetical protein
MSWKLHRKVGKNFQLMLLKPGASLIMAPEEITRPLFYREALPKIAQDSKTSSRI